MGGCPGNRSKDSSLAHIALGTSFGLRLHLNPTLNTSYGWKSLHFNGV